MRNNVSLFQKFTAREYEDLLQVSYIPHYCHVLLAHIQQVVIPAIQGLLPKRHNKLVMSLMYVLATYQGLGKLRLHTEDTLDYWENICQIMGELVRQFRDCVCPSFQTKETPREAQARARRSAKKTSKPGNSSRRLKPFNLLTYKFHAVGDGPSTVREFGTTDSYSTWIVSPRYHPLSLKLTDLLGRGNSCISDQSNISIGRQRTRQVRVVLQKWTVVRKS